ncbi:predicted protein [Histoplasma capsulatum H143]|uniref:Uncharacterized protein n=1 Tax=Ajellomyces capsulatus (strain H143) TaxID=544712 RepID=C6HL56_AJECH|nr:predicted protein [Histoplasma capsulatum H143]
MERRTPEEPCFCLNPHEFMKTFDDSKSTGFLEWQCEIYDYRIKYENLALSYWGLTEDPVLGSMKAWSGASGHTPTRDSGYGCRLMCSLSYISGSRLIALFNRFVIMTIIFKIHSDKAKAIGPMMFPWLLGANGKATIAADSQTRKRRPGSDHFNGVLRATLRASTEIRHLETVPSPPIAASMARRVSIWQQMVFTSVDYFGSNDLAREDQSIFINDKYHGNDVEKVYSYGSISASRRPPNSSSFANTIMRFLLITDNPEPVSDLRLQFVAVEFHDDDDFAADE